MKFTPRFCLISAQPYHNLCRVAIPDLKTNGKYLNEQPLSGSLHTLDLNRHPGELCAGIVALTQENANVTKLPAHAGALTVSPDFVGARGGRIGQRPFVGRGRLGRILSPQSCCFQIRLLRGWGKIHVELFLALADRKADRAVLSLYGFFFGHGLTLAFCTSATSSASPVSPHQAAACQ